METIASSSANARSNTRITYRVEPVDQYASASVGYLMVKRTMDFVAALIGLILGFVPMLVIAALIRLDSKGPAIYKQERLGLKGKPFILYKFRSMRADAEKNGAQWAEKEDLRVTRLGRILRKSRLDELPQLVNILRGDMSLVGPRPERAVFYEQFETYIPGFSQRLKIMPGLTGLAQIKGGYDLKPEEKIVLDIEYMKTRSVVLDIKILVLTVGIVFNHRGAR